VVERRNNRDWKDLGHMLNILGEEKAGAGVGLR